MMSPLHLLKFSCINSRKFLLPNLYNRIDLLTFKFNIQHSKQSFPSFSLLTLATSAKIPMASAEIPKINDGCLTVRGNAVFTGVPDNVVVSPASGGSAFLGATAATPSSRHVFTIGTLQGYRFLCLFRFKIWWMIPRVGKSGGEIPVETQMLLLEVTQDSSVATQKLDSDPFYILLLPVLEGPFRASLQGTSANELQFCVESGDVDVQTSQVFESVFVNSGENPFSLINDSVKILEKHKGTFCHIDNKKLPAHLDWFGWCTWDAFYSQVNPQGIEEGLQKFLEGGCSPKFLIVDDGWQETANEFCKEGESPPEGTQFTSRLVDIRENAKFRSSGSDSTCTNLHEFIDKIKEKYGLKLVYMWHALAGYWGGVLPSGENMKMYNPKLVYPIQSPGNVANVRDIVPDILEKYGVGVIDPSKIFDFYNDLHSYLASCNVDGVKVDVQNLMETLGSGNGGRVTLTRKYQNAVEESVARNFKGNNLICCMSHNTDSIYSSRKSAVARASEDFMPREPTLQTLHIASVSFNSLLLGEIVVPDWDMFHSKHNTAEFHGAARAVGGCAVYVSDKPGEHDFKILKKLVLPDGSILRARQAGRPTRDCLFIDPVMDGKSLLKIWNLNKLSGVIGVFNCQGAGNWPLKEAKEIPSAPLSSLSGHARPTDIEFLEEIACENWNGDCAVYAFNSGSLSVLPKNETFEVSLATLQCEIYTISPIRVFGENISFSPIGLADMYNSGGAVEAVNSRMNFDECIVTVKGRGCGRFGAYSSIKPNSCLVDNSKVEFSYNAVNGLLTVELVGDCNSREIEFVY